MSTKAGAQAATVAPPPFADVKGRPVLKDFICETTHKLRPFKGTVTKFFADKL